MAGGATSAARNATLNGAELYLQLLVADAGAPKGVAFSKGLAVVLGT